MLQVDSSKRPRIEELTNLPALQSALRQSNIIVKEAQLKQVPPLPSPSLLTLLLFYGLLTGAVLLCQVERAQVPRGFSQRS